ncbi:MAG: Sulfate transporter/antisigma-factor antagonist [Proteobacteria bacterium]|nr:Sulfate transporter/antisigma-factor antagonist [Pseudomonadota bacterium]
MPSSPLSISEDLTIYHALALKDKLLAALAETSELELNLSHVEAIDTAGLQLLVLLKKEARRSGKCVRIVAHSQAVSSLVEFCNMAAEFGDPLVIPAAHAAPR